MYDKRLGRAIVGFFRDICLQVVGPRLSLRVEHGKVNTESQKRILDDISELSGSLA